MTVASTSVFEDFVLTGNVACQATIGVRAPIDCTGEEFETIFARAVRSGKCRFRPVAGQQPCSVVAKRQFPDEPEQDDGDDWGERSPAVVATPIDGQWFVRQLR